MTADDVLGRLRRAAHWTDVDDVELVDRVRRAAQECTDPDLRAELVATWRALRRYLPPAPIVAVPVDVDDPDDVAAALRAVGVDVVEVDE